MENLTESYRVPLNQMHGFCCIQAPGINRQERRSMFRSFMLIIISGSTAPEKNLEE